MKNSVKKLVLAFTVAVVTTATALDAQKSAIAYNGSSDPSAQVDKAPPSTTTAKVFKTAGRDITDPPTDVESVDLPDGLKDHEARVRIDKASESGEYIAILANVGSQVYVAMPEVKEKIEAYINKHFSGKAPVKIFFRTQSDLNLYEKVLFDVSGNGAPFHGSSIGKKELAERAGEFSNRFKAGEPPATAPSPAGMN